MAKKKPRKPYRRPDFRAEAARLNPEKYAAPETPAEEDLPYKPTRPVRRLEADEKRHFEEQMHRAGERLDAQRAADRAANAPKPPRKPRVPRPKPVTVDKEPVAPAHPHVVPGATPRAPRRVGRYLVPVAAAGSVVGGTAYLARRSERKKAEMAKGLIDPTTGQSVSYERVLIDDVVDKAMKFTGVRDMRGAEFKVRTRDRGVQAARKARSAVTTDRVALGSGGVLVGAALPRKSDAAKRYDDTALRHHGSRRVGGNTPVSSVRVPGLPVQSARFSRGNATARPGTRSNALKLTRVHTRVKAPRTGKLFHLGSRSKTPAPLRTYGKSAAFAQSAGNGRRLVNI